jgi:hypothetical protein
MTGELAVTTPSTGLALCISPTPAGPTTAVPSASVDVSVLRRELMPVDAVSLSGIEVPAIAQAILGVLRPSSEVEVGSSIVCRQVVAVQNLQPRRSHSQERRSYQVMDVSVDPAELDRRIAPRRKGLQYPATPPHLASVAGCRHTIQRPDSTLVRNFHAENRSPLLRGEGS